MDKHKATIIPIFTKLDPSDWPGWEGLVEGQYDPRLDSRLYPDAWKERTIVRQDTREVLGLPSILHTCVQLEVLRPE
jgi:hypothetical protein